jgi:hypothetical protein
VKKQAEYAEKNLKNYLDEALKNNKDKFSNKDELIKISLEEAFDKVENSFLEIAR